MLTLPHGVVVTPLNLVANERGRLLEVQRSDDPAFPGFGQIYVTQSFAGVIKAWYRHRVQVDQIAAITGLVKLVLYDDREASRTKGMITEIYMGELAPKLVLIPPGVWHGFKAVGESGAFLVHLNDQPFMPDAPDEERLDIATPKIPYTW
jgi:dTDP-4-dehydrorhamnose 3,5-epimerase